MLLCCRLQCAPPSHSRDPFVACPSCWTGQGVVLSEADWTLLAQRVDPDRSGSVVQERVLDALGIERATASDDPRGPMGPPPAPGSFEVRPVRPPPSLHCILPPPPPPPYPFACACPVSGGRHC